MQVRVRSWISGSVGASVMVVLAGCVTTPHSGGPVVPPTAPPIAVTQTGDVGDGVCDNSCTLREAIAKANATAASDTIQLPAGTFTVGSLAPVHGRSARKAAAPPGSHGEAFEVTAPLTIHGAGLGVTNIDLSGDTYTTGWYTTADLTFESLTIENLNGGLVTGPGQARTLIVGEFTAAGHRVRFDHSEIRDIGRLADDSVETSSAIAWSPSVFPGPPPPGPALFGFDLEIESSLVHHNARPLGGPPGTGGDVTIRSSTFSDTQGLFAGRLTGQPPTNLLIDHSTLENTFLPMGSGGPGCTPGGVIVLGGHLDLIDSTISEGQIPVGCQPWALGGDALGIFVTGYTPQPNQLFEATGSFNVVRSSITAPMPVVATADYYTPSLTRIIAAIEDSTITSTRVGVAASLLLAATDLTVQRSTITGVIQSQQDSTVSIGQSLVDTRVDNPVPGDPVVACYRSVFPSLPFVSGNPTITSTGDNVFAGTCEGDGVTTLPSDLIGVDPGLGVLGMHGGTTTTRVPAAGSPALDRYPCSGTDQRGVVRAQGASCDSGAVERSATD